MYIKSLILFFLVFTAQIHAAINIDSWSTNDGAKVEYPNEYEGHGLREQALELEKCVKNNTIESSIFPHAEMLQVMESMDKIRSIIGLQF